MSSRPIHLNSGWRYWAFVSDGGPADDLAAGFDPNGYGTREEALAAVAEAQKVVPEHVWAAELAKAGVK